MAKKTRQQLVKRFAEKGLTAFRVTDSAFAPMADRGELVLADPLRPPEDGKRALVVLRGSRRVLYRYWQAEGELVHLSTGSPASRARSYTVPRGAVLSACKVVGTVEP
jgi:hypothetical protein